MAVCHRCPLSTEVVVCDHREMGKEGGEVQESPTEPPPSITSLPGIPEARLVVTTSALETRQLVFGSPDGV